MYVYANRGVCMYVYVYPGVCVYVCVDMMYGSFVDGVYTH